MTKLEIEGKKFPPLLSFFLQSMLTPTFYQDSKMNAVTSDFQTFVIFFLLPSSPSKETLEENMHGRNPWVVKLIQKRI